MKNIFKKKVSKKTFWIITISFAISAISIISIYNFEPRFIPEPIREGIKKTIDGDILGDKNQNSQEQNNNQNTETNNQNNSNNSSSNDMDTSSWKTYTNEEYGFSVKYPEGWTLNNKTEELQKTNNDTLSYTILDPKFNNLNDARISIETKKSYGLEQDIDREFTDVVINKKQDININEINSKIITGDAIDYETNELISHFITVLVPNNNQVIIFNYIKSINDEENLQKEFESIYHSFIPKKY